jgi:SagB-type dehydrogenase family enzyme
MPPPPIQKPIPSGSEPLLLPPAEELLAQGLGSLSVGEAIRRRQSVRVFADAPLARAELAYLLWCTQGVRARRGAHAVLRTVPSAGNRHALETYVYCRQVDGLSNGIYRYLPEEHALVCEVTGDDLTTRLISGCRGQRFAGECAATFIWTTVPYRMEWRYDLVAHKVIALDAGHVCQNLYLACQSIGAGTCAIAAYDQGAMDALLGLDGDEEFTIYIAPVGKVT